MISIMEKIDTTAKHTLWSNKNLNLDDWREDLQECNPDLSEEELYEEMCKVNDDYLDDLRAEVKDIVFDTPIAVLGNIGTWQGVAGAFKSIDSGKLSDCFYDSCGYCEWYVDENNDLRFTGSHHDGNNSYLYRAYKDELDDEDIEEFEDKVLSDTVTKEDIEKYTYGIGDVFAKLYGWEDWGVFMIEQTYKIRHNEDGSIVSQDVRDIIDLSLKHGILQGVKNDYVIVYHEASETNPEQYPAGWYKDDYEIVVQELMRSDEGFNCILDVLSENNILFVPSLSTEVLNMIRKIANELKSKEK